MGLINLIKSYINADSFEAKETISNIPEQKLKINRNFELNTDQQALFNKMEKDVNP